MILDSFISRLIASSATKPFGKVLTRDDKTIEFDFCNFISWIFLEKLPYNILVKKPVQGKFQVIILTVDK